VSGAISAGHATILRVLFVVFAPSWGSAGITWPLENMTIQTVVMSRFPDRARFVRAADWLAIAVAVSFPWSTSATGILVALWLLAVIPTLDIQSLRRNIAIPAATIPIALFAFGVAGMAWSGASLGEQLGSIKPTVRLLAIPLLFIQFRNSSRGTWVIAGFLVSCATLLAVSWLVAMWPALAPSRPTAYPGVPVKDYIIQSGEFLICAFALTHLAIGACREERWRVAAAYALLALIFLLNIAFVATARSTLVIFAVLVVVLAFQRFDWRGIVGVMAAGVVLAGVAWASSPYLRERVLAAVQEIREYRSQDAATSSGLRLEFWKKSIEFIAAAPVFGHGTGSVELLFRAAASDGTGASAAVTDQPHNQTLIVAIQLGLVGAALLYGVWISHLLLFRGGGLAAWLGFGVVVQNIVAGLFNSYLFEFTLGWVYVFGVGVLGGMVLGRRGSGQAGAPDSTVAPGGEGR
jgi:O-antigen ligase